jgi:hypothetical protein
LLKRNWSEKMKSGKICSVKCVIYSVKSDFSFSTKLFKVGLHFLQIFLQIFRRKRIFKLPPKNFRVYSPGNIFPLKISFLA